MTFLEDLPYEPVRHPVNKGPRWQCNRCDIAWTDEDGRCQECGRLDMVERIAPGGFYYTTHI